ncbi:hypothetical protein NL108_001494 [Boleophthalmus pectinirostris]|uniref:makorin, ring finger protein, 4 n=1 Tax=Boleophthalmus pectinirostris TaxID=150288 RepID=UPI00242D5436|nr:makorin, ring finger protein, 4 [Boleophthalmus pectinirostris]KAJ0064181.1 hypothetical protein NL108_001494 [Boleophthalmus pectinirostris]
MERLNRNGSICRRFLSGNCIYGDGCRFRHVRPTQMCRHFLKGDCWFGDRCKFLHVFPSGGRLSFFSSVAPGLSERSVSEHTVVQADSHGPNTSSNQASNVAMNTIEAHSLERRFRQMDLAQSSETGRLLQRNVPNEEMEGATAGPSQSADRAQAILRSKDMSCGICMDKIFEKRELGERRFGILPNCNHTFCLKCIKTWRKTRRLSPDVVKSCPQCRVKSGFYVPHDYWVEGQEKESLIAAFKNKFSKKTCDFYLRQGRCPFKSDCLYRHDKKLPPHEISEDTDDLYTSDVLNLLLAMALIDSDDEDDDYDEEFNIFDMPLYLIREHVLHP